MVAKLSSRVGLPVLIGETQLTSQPPVLILFGRDGGGKPRAAWFDAADAEAVTTAASATKMRILPLIDDTRRELARQLARGRLLPSGRALVPFAKRDLYARLVVLADEGSGLVAAAASWTDPASAGDASTADLPAEAEAPATADAGTVASSDNEQLSDGREDAAPPVREPACAPLAPRPGAHLFVGQPRPEDRSGIGLGSIVLAQEGPDDGWWEAEVIGANGRTFSLRWRDYDPTAFPTILRTADELALLPPGAP